MYAYTTVKSMFCDGQVEVLTPIQQQKKNTVKTLDEQFTWLSPVLS